MKLVRILHQDSLLPHPSDFHYNLALEEVILQHHEEQNEYVGTLRFWKNPPSVIVGRHQLIEEEINIEFCKRHHILIGRRISGGGTVYHDEGNLNTSFFFPKELLPVKNDLKEITSFFTDLILSSLTHVGITNLEREGHSNIFYEKKKISGAASYQRKNWILHHTTLLLKANLTNLEGSLLARSSKPSNRRGSRYFPTTNLPLKDVEKWKKILIKKLEESLHVKVIPKTLTAREKKDAMILSRYMYSKKEWIYLRKRTLLDQIRNSPKKERNEDKNK